MDARNPQFPAPSGVLSSVQTVGTLDRYVMRQILPPFLMALSVCTFVLLMGPMMEQAELLLAKGVPILRGPTDLPEWRHRTLFFRDPEDNIIEIYAEY